MKKKRTRKKKCKYCGEYFLPDPRSKGRQKYCGKDECRKASNRASSKKYRDKKKTDPEWREKENERTRKWRKKNPGYWRRYKKVKNNCSKNPQLRDLIRAEKKSKECAQRDSSDYYSSCLKGLVWHLTGGERDGIDTHMNFYYDKGREL